MQWPELQPSLQLFSKNFSKQLLHINKFWHIYSCTYDNYKIIRSLCCIFPWKTVKHGNTSRWILLSALVNIAPAMCFRTIGTCSVNYYWQKPQHICIYRSHFPTPWMIVRWEYCWWFQGCPPYLYSQLIRTHEWLMTELTTRFSRTCRKTASFKLNSKAYKHY